MGLICLVIMVTGFTFISGETSASFLDRRSFCSANDEFRISQNAEVRKPAYSRRIQLLIPSGPPAFLGFSSKRTSDGLIVNTSELSENRGGHASGLKKSRIDHISSVKVGAHRDPVKAEIRVYVFATSSRIHTRYHLDLIPPLAGLGGLKVGDFGCIVLSATHTISDVTKVSETLSITLRICLLTRLNKSFKLSRHPRSVIYVKFNCLERHDGV